jgi:transcriptional regulator with XRE-family HTH domain
MMNIYKTKDGYTYNRESGEIHDPQGNFFGQSGLYHSNKYIELSLKMSSATTSQEMEKYAKKLEYIKISEKPYILTTPTYIYIYLLYKLRKLSGFNQEDIAFEIGMSGSTYTKIENRLLIPSINNLHTTMYVFGMSNIEFAELFDLVLTSVITNRGNITITPDMSDYNTEKEIFLGDSDTSDYDRCTPIDLYDRKFSKEALNKIETKFLEVILEGKKRWSKRNEEQKKFDEERQKKHDEVMNYSKEEFNKYQGNLRIEELIGYGEREEKEIEYRKKWNGF